MKVNKKLVRNITALLLFFELTFINAAFAKDGSQRILTKVDVLQLFPRTLKSYATYVGYLKPRVKVNISSELAGVVEDLNVVQGSAVKKGDLLVQIDTKRLLLNRKLSKSNYELALKEFEREDTLLQKKLSTPAKVANLKNSLDVNRLRLELSELDLIKSRIKTPIDGIVSQRAIEVGEYVKVGDKLLDILDISIVLAIINIPEREIRYIEKGKEVELTADALPGKIFLGKVHSIGLEANMQSRSFEVEVLVENDQQKLLPGMLIRAKLIKINIERQTIIPRHTIQEEERGSFVYIVVNSKIVKRNIKMGVSVDDEVQVLKGLNFGEMLVETGQQLVVPDEQIEVISIKKQK